MNIVGIVAEYNPFHKGHLHHMVQSRNELGEDCPIICVMSGNFTQRGDAAVFNKFARAESAVLSGADLVFELPLPWALSSAEGFSRGAVGLLGSLGVVTHLSFGSESGHMDELSEIAETLMSPSTDELIRRELTENPIPYAAARMRALEAQLGERAKILEKPNNILAVEYLKAIYDQRFDIEPLTVAREGAGHDMFSRNTIRSASELRGNLFSGKDITKMVPEASAQIISREIIQGRGPVSIEDLETPIISRLRMLSEGAYNSIPDASEGLGNRLCRAAWSEPSLDAIYSVAKTKRYALSRIRRMTICAALGITAGMNAGVPPYARLLASSARGCDILRQINEFSRIPVITKPASVKKLEKQSQIIFGLETAATDLYALGYKAIEERRGGSDWRKSPVILD